LVRFAFFATTSMRSFLVRFLTSSHCMVRIDTNHSIRLTIQRKLRVVKRS
jgi:hypothetical protein